MTCGKHRVVRLRRDNDMMAKRRKRFVVTTRSRHRHWIAPDLLQRDLTASKPNTVWVGDVSQVPTRSGWLYLAIVPNLYSRKVVGWSMSDKNNQALVLGALTMAIEQRHPPLGLIHHTDRGQLYATD